MLKGGGPEVWEPRFTFHGFQYVELTGLDTVPARSAVTGCVIHSAAPPAGRFECSHPGVNRLWRNSLWSQRGNFLSVPTDCPQRDERLGWTGDAQVFLRTASCNLDVAAFFTKWMTDVADAQTPAGVFPERRRACAKAWTSPGWAGSPAPRGGPTPASSCRGHSGASTATAGSSSATGGR